MLTGLSADLSLLSLQRVLQRDPIAEALFDWEDVHVLNVPNGHGPILNSDKTQQLRVEAEAVIAYSSTPSGGMIQACAETIYMGVRMEMRIIPKEHALCLAHHNFLKAILEDARNFMPDLTKILSTEGQSFTLPEGDHPFQKEIRRVFETFAENLYYYLRDRRRSLQRSMTDMKKDAGQTKDEAADAESALEKLSGKSRNEVSNDEIGEAETRRDNTKEAAETAAKNLAAVEAKLNALTSFLENGKSKAFKVFINPDSIEGFRLLAENEIERWNDLVRTMYEMVDEASTDLDKFIEQVDDAITKLVEKHDTSMDWNQPVIAYARRDAHVVTQLMLQSGDAKTNIEEAAKAFAPVKQSEQITGKVECTGTNLTSIDSDDKAEQSTEQ